MGTESKETKAKVKRTGLHTTQIFVWWEDGDGETGIQSFANKPELDTWLGNTNVTVKMVIRGRERKVRRKVIFQ